MACSCAPHDLLSSLYSMHAIGMHHNVQQADRWWKLRYTDLITSTDFHWWLTSKGLRSAEHCCMVHAWLQELCVFACTPDSDSPLPIFLPHSCLQVACGNRSLHGRVLDDIITSQRGANGVFQHHYHLLCFILTGWRISRSVLYQLTFTDTVYALAV